MSTGSAYSSVTTYRASPAGMSMAFDPSLISIGVARGGTSVK